MSIEDKIKRGDSRVLAVETENDLSVQLSCETINGIRKFRISKHQNGKLLSEAFEFGRTKAWNLFEKGAEEIK